VIKDGPAPAGGVKSIGFVTRKAGMPIDEFFRRWLEHGAPCARAPALRRYVQCHTRRSIYDSGRTPAYDGVAMAWADSEEALRAASATPEFARLQEDRESFVARDHSPFVLASERVVLP
jgi:uncharacterized protein (TIGR02118 family)